MDTRCIIDAAHLCIRANASVYARTTPSGDEIHHGTGDVLLMVTVGDPGWAGCARCGPTDVGLDSGPLLRLSPFFVSSPLLFRRVDALMLVQRAVFIRIWIRVENGFARTTGDCRTERVKRAIAAQERAPIDLRACLTLCFTTASSLASEEYFNPVVRKIYRVCVIKVVWREDYEH